MGRVRADDREGGLLERLLEPLRGLARHDATGVGLMFAAAAVAIAWANSPWASSYERLLELRIVVGTQGLALSKPLQVWVNDGLMGLFFFLVGLEIKREVLAGQLSSWRRAMLPIWAAVGGMVVPALLYVAISPGGALLRGWGIPMATDIAFALGVLTLAGRRAPVGLKVFLTALAIVDDLGAILVIAIFYTDEVVLPSLGLGALLLAISLLGSRLGVRSAVFYFVLGTLTWLSFLRGGVHATLAAVLMALTIPARTRLDGPAFLARIEALLAELRAAPPRRSRLLTPVEGDLLERVNITVEGGTAPLQRLERALAPVVAFLVLPVFALANAGVDLSLTEVGAALSHPVGLGVLVGLFLGKQVGILGASWLAVRLGLADLPARVAWRHVHAVAALGGIGFTMALFIGSLAFRDPGLQDVAKVGTLAASLLSAALGWGLLATSPGRREVPAPAPVPAAAPA